MVLYILSCLEILRRMYILKNLDQFNLTLAYVLCVALLFSPISAIRFHTLEGQIAANHMHRYFQHLKRNTIFTIKRN